jgi:hypothetical protein
MFELRANGVPVGSNSSVGEEQQSQRQRAAEHKVFHGVLS